MLASRAEGPRRPGEFLAEVAAGLASRLGPTVDNLEDMLDEIEEAMLEHDQADDLRARAQVATIRRQAIGYRRFLAPQREAFGRLALATTPLFSERDRLELRVAAEGVTRITEALEEIRDRAAVTADELRARHEARIGRTLYLLTIVATIALPLGIITGLLGVNVGGVPLAHSSAGFAVVCAVLAAIVVIEVILFRVARWL